MHCARLGFQGLELLRTRRLALPIEGEPADWLRAVRRGEVSFDDWWERVLGLDAQLERLASDESIPAGPDRTQIEMWSVATHLRVWSSGTVALQLRDFGRAADGPRIGDSSREN
jgi:uncharacterized protein